MLKGLASLKTTLQSGMDLAGGPMGLLLNPAALKEVGDNVAAALPRSDIMLDVCSRLMAEAIAKTMIARGPSPTFIEAIAQGDAQQATLTWNALWMEVANG